MTVLLLRLAGPMQSWGTRSRFTQRDTELEPSKSGVIGMLCAALGWPRDSDTFPIAGSPYSLEQLSGSLRMGIRVDREGRLMRDYHTAQDVRRADPSKGTQDTVVSERFYLADADFLVGLEGEPALLEALDAALRAPVWPLYLGRKAFPPAPPLALGIAGGELLGVLQGSKWRRWERTAGSEDVRLRYVIEVPYGQGVPRSDVPLSFISQDRRFAVRHVQIELHPLRPELIVGPEDEELSCS